jgi:hypothetical protein
VLAAAALAAGAAGCGDGDEEPRVTTLVESAEPLPQLPKDWTVHHNEDAGFAIGVPPGWKARDRGITTELRSPEALAAVSVAADRTREVIDAPLAEVATATISAPIPKLRDVEPGDPRPFRHSYDAVALRATGASVREDFRQRLLLVILRREDIVTFTVLAAHNAEEHRRFYEGEIERMIRSLRSRPIGSPARSAQGSEPSD